ncbi:MAG: helix-turn-helix domain-containing protein [Actinobacteria bacterium]|uniref:Unannotated protein n=1 Tax=freshwater metagenome TaxID=449393 RepID=A0A6J5Z105_9ZZZZ|nr:helix-turn-helix domain-containing protein [Actinomycetota bacterium]
MSEKPVTGTQSIDRACDLLMRVISSPSPMTLTELVGATGLAKGTTSRILSALERAELIARSKLGGYEPGEVLNRFAIRGGAYGWLVDMTAPALAEVATISRETTNIAVVGQRGLDSIAQVDGSFFLGGRSWVGDFVPLHATAAGKVLLAYGVASIPKFLEARTPETITNRSELVLHLKQVRDRGYATIRNELELGLVAIAVPVLSSSGEVIAAMSVTGPADRMPEGDMLHIADVMNRALEKAYKNSYDQVPTREGAA